MNSIKKFKVIIGALIAILGLTIFSCTDKKKDPIPSNVEDPNIPKGPLLIHLHHYVGFYEVEGDGIYQDANGRQISFDLAQFYLSNFQLKRADGSYYSIPDTLILKVLEQESYLIANVPIGKYQSISFNVGLNPIANKKSPTSSIKDPLNHPEMWFESNAQPGGYVFLNVKGKIDTTLNATGADVDMAPFEYRIGTDANYVQKVMPDQNITVIEDGAMIHLYADLSQLFNGVKIQNKDNLTLTTISENSSDLAKQIVRNIPNMFKYENE